MAKLLLCLVPLAFSEDAGAACSSSEAKPSKDHVLLQGGARVHSALSLEQREVASGKASGCSYVTGKRAVAVVQGRATCGDTSFKKMPRDKRRSLRDFHMTSSIPPMLSSSVPPCISSTTTTTAMGPPPPPPTGVTVKCDIHGDPHITDMAGKKFDVLLPLGDYWLVKAKHLQIQARYCSPSATGSGIAMGIAVTGSNLPLLTILSKFNNDAHPFVMIDDEPVMPEETLAGQNQYLNPNLDAGAYKLQFLTSGWSPGSIAVQTRQIKIEGKGGLWITIVEANSEMKIEIEVDEALLEGGASGHCGTLDDHSEATQGAGPNDLAGVDDADLMFKHQTCPWIAGSPSAGQVLLEQKLAENSFVYTQETCPKIEQYRRECAQAWPGEVHEVDNCVVDCCDGADCPAEDDMNSNIESIRVTGAGISAANGRYVKGEKMYGKDSWSMGVTVSNVSRRFAIVHLVDRWILDENFEGLALYSVESKVFRPPFSGWETGAGAGPAPRLVAEGPGPAMSLLSAPKTTDTFQLCSCSRNAKADKQGVRKDKKRKKKDRKKKTKKDHKKRTTAGKRKDKKRSKKDTRKRRSQRVRALLATNVSRESREDAIGGMQGTRTDKPRKKKRVMRGGHKDRKKRVVRKDKKLDKKQLGYFFISAGESCEEVCDARGAKCDLAALKVAAVSVDKCNEAINQIL